MSLALDSPITWRSMVRLGLGFAAEYALLALIEDATVELKIATVLCAVGALAILETETKLRAQKTFGRSIAIVSGIYLLFVLFAVRHVVVEIEIGRKLDALYGVESDIERRPFSGGMNAVELKDWEDHINGWRDETSEFLEINIGQFAKNRFLNTKGLPSLNYDGATPEINGQINYVIWLRKNLEAVIDMRVKNK